MVQHRYAPPYCLTSFHEHNGILFQFILHEFLFCHRLVSTLEKKLLDHADTSELYETLQVLTGPTREELRHFPWCAQEGSLARLKNFCAILVDNTEEKEARFIQLRNAAIVLWQKGMHCLGLLRGNHAMQDALADMVHEFPKVAPHLWQSIPYFAKDENLLYLLLRRKNALEKVFGKQNMIHIFATMHPEGIDSIRRFLKQNFTERGFEQRLPQIEQTLNELIP